PKDVSDEIPSVPSHAYFGGVGPGCGTPNSVLLYVECSLVSLSLSFTVPTISPCRSCSCSSIVPVLVWTASSVPSMPETFLVHFSLPSLVHVSTLLEPA